MQESNALFERRSLQEMTNMKLGLVDELKNHRSQLDRHKFWENRKPADLARLAREKETMASICSQMDNMVQQSTSVATELKILKSLHFPHMEARHDAIKQAYSDTFGWIFEGSQTPYKSWLQNGKGIFWVSGKAGSGKSTLMKYLCGHPSTHEILDHWAGKKQLVVAKFFFWHGGTPMQKSQEGLLQSLLFQLLNKCPELIPIATPTRWKADNKFHHFPPSWSKEELVEALKATISQGKLPARFCFFIDGLDEYSGDYDDIVARSSDQFSEADHYALTIILKELARSEDVKICVSSRPWNPFRKAFGEDQERTFVLDKLTQTDMDHYIKGHLESDPRFVQLARNNDEAQELISEIANRAEGVFLWVYLAVRSLLRGLSESDGIPELRGRLRLLPPRLKDFFGLMLKSIDPAYRTLTCRLLTLANYAAPLPLIAFWCIMTELDDPDYAVKAKIEHYPEEQIPATNAAAITCVNKWCRDLLEVRATPLDASIAAKLYDSNITFLHRTVIEFLADPDIRSFLRQNVGPGFIEEISTCRIHLAEAKTLPGIMSTKAGPSRFLGFATEVMRNAKFHELRSGAPAIDLLDELDNVGTHLLSSSARRHWTQQFSVDMSKQQQSWVQVRDQGQSNFTAFAVAHSLDLFVAAKLKQNPGMVKKSGRPLLEYALHPTFSNTYVQPAPCTISVDMVKVLLSAGANVNENAAVLGNATVWQVLLHDCYHGRTEQIRPVIKLFLDYGADPDCIVPIKQSASALVPIGNLTGSRHTRMDLVSGELVEKTNTTVYEALSKVMSDHEVATTLAEARTGRHQDSVPTTRSWFLWPWR
jgi:hypothetical protein